MTRTYCTVLDKDHIRMNGETLMVCLPSGNGIQMENGDGKSAVEFNIDTEAMCALIEQMSAVVCMRFEKKVKDYEGLLDSIAESNNEEEQKEEEDNE